ADAVGEAVYLDLERPADRRRLDDADAYLRAQAGKLVVIDEIHRAPEIFAVLRGIMDDRRASGDEHGGFLLLGSASLDLMRQSTESLAGRISFVELAPFDVREFPGAGLRTDALWVRGGFPRALLAGSDADSLTWRRDFIRSYLERDVPMFAPRLPAETIARLWGMLAHGQGTLLNQSRLASSLGVSAPAVGRYVDLLVDLLLVRRLRPWSGDVGKRLVRSPKVWVRDSGLLHALLDLEAWDDVLGHPVSGPSWEGFVIENLIAAAGDRRVPYFYRTADGAEIDLVFERGGLIEVAIEIKRSTAPGVSRGFHAGCSAVGAQEKFVVHGGDGEWPMGGGVTAISLAGLVQRLSSRA
ncbi:MAG TPA: ATP-binding protein, partial [Longimicrobiales bacterium]|nr:ATP-binding protein [Longimicrobiales bacterium]